MDNRKLIGVVTVTYNSGGVIDDFMKSILKQTYADFILYLVDNNSSDDTLKRFGEYRDTRIVAIPNQVNAGVAEGNNIGIRTALKDGCASVLLINNDTTFDSDLVSKLVEGLTRYGCEMVVPKILFFDQPDTIWCAGGYFSRLRAASRHFGYRRKDDGQFDQPRVVDYSPTCCMLIRREVFDQIGLMDPNYFVYFDDTDFCWRAHKAGVKLFYQPDARMEHKVGSLTGGTQSDFTLRYCIRNHAYYILKHYSRWQILFYCGVLYLYIPAKFLLFLGRPKLFWSTQKAFWEGITLFFSKVGRSRRVFG